MSFAQRRVDRLGQLGAAAADVEHEGLRALREAVEVALQERRMAPPHAEPLPHAVTKDEARVEHRYDRLLARHELAVDPDEDALVARVVLELVRAAAHQAEPYVAGYRSRPDEFGPWSF